MHNTHVNGKMERSMLDKNQIQITICRGKNGIKTPVKFCHLSDIDFMLHKFLSELGFEGEVFFFNDNFWPNMELLILPLYEIFSVDSN